jgi:hypothetical protein
VSYDIVNETYLTIVDEKEKLVIDIFGNLKINLKHMENIKQLANDGMPKQGEMVEARYKTECGVLSNWFLVKFVCSYE